MQVSAESINLAICDIMTQLLTVEPSPDIPAWFARIVNYLKDFLQGKCDTKIVGQSSKTIVQILRRFMMLGVREGKNSSKCFVRILVIMHDMILVKR